MWQSWSQSSADSDGKRAGGRAGQRAGQRYCRQAEKAGRLWACGQADSSLRYRYCRYFGRPSERRATRASEQQCLLNRVSGWIEIKSIYERSEFPLPFRFNKFEPWKNIENRLENQYRQSLGVRTSCMQQRQNCKFSFKTTIESLDGLRSNQSMKEVNFLYLSDLINLIHGRTLKIN